MLKNRIRKRSKQIASILTANSGGREWIRTIEAKRNRFTVCPLWPLGNSPIWSWWWDSNPRPADYKSAALPIELHQHVLCCWWELQGSNLWHPACKADALPAELIAHIGDLWGIRTPEPAVKGRCLNRLTNRPLMVIHPRLERGTPWLKVKCSTDWASGSFGRGSRIRTYAWRSQSPLPYRLAIPLLAPEAGFEPATSWLTVTRSTGWAIQESIETSYDVTNYGAENGTRTRDPNLGKVVLYHWATSAFA